jgi:propionate catabolism operon transcriptional regulator
LARRKEKENEEEMHTILQIIKEGLIVLDKEGKVKICNQMAADILGLDRRQTGHRLPEFLRETGLLNVLNSGEAEIDQIRRVRGEYIVVNSSPIKIEDKTCGVVSTFKEASRIHKIDLMIKEKSYPKGFVAKYYLEHIAGGSPNIRRVVEKARKYAETDLTILIQGESGTGKEVLGQAIHNLGRRKKFPFIAINCSELTESLLESELFGYEEGAFTGAKKGGKLGLFELGNQGSILLDEIADIPLNTQAKLLRVIEEKQVRRIGGDRLIHVDVRIISSTWKDLVEEMELGAFRRDLYFRLACLKLTIPPLRERLHDIPDILLTLLQKYGKGTDAISPGMMERMKNYSWPGNIRELNSVVESYLILLGSSRVDERLFHELFDDLCENEVSAPAEPSPVGSRECRFLPPGSTLRDQLEEHEKAIIQETLRKFRFNRKETAKYLGVSVNTLWRKLNSQ